MITSLFPGLVGGVLIGLAAVWLMSSLGRIAGISGIVAGLFLDSGSRDVYWRMAFVLGLIGGPVMLAVLGINGNLVSGARGLLGSPVTGPSTMAIGGLLIGLGTGIGSGCTSGHGVCGLARLSLRSLVAMVVFLATAMLTVLAIYHL